MRAIGKTISERHGMLERVLRFEQVLNREKGLGGSAVHRARHVTDPGQAAFRPADHYGVGAGAFRISGAIL